MKTLEEILLKNSIEHPARTMGFSDLTKGLFAEVEKDNVDVNYHPDFPHLAIFKYSRGCQIERNWNIFTIMARGLILDLENKVVVATSFIKFFNYGELVNVKDFISLDFVATEKIDGCCHEDVILITEDGQKTIREICDKRYKGKVLSYNIYSDVVEFKEIEGYFISPDKKQWYELEMEDGVKVKLTGNHKVYLPELNCYRRVDKLKGDEIFLLKK